MWDIFPFVRLATWPFDFNQTLCITSVTAQTSVLRLLIKLDRQLLAKPAKFVQIRNKTKSSNSYHNMYLALWDSRYSDYRSCLRICSYSKIASWHSNDVHITGSLCGEWHTLTKKQIKGLSVFSLLLTWTTCWGDMKYARCQRFHTGHLVWSCMQMNLLLATHTRFYTKATHRNG